MSTGKNPGIGRGVNSMNAAAVKSFLVLIVQASERGDLKLC